MNMSHPLRAAGAAALAMALVGACSPPSGDQARSGRTAGSTAGTDLAPAAQAIIDATRAGIAFQAVSNTRFRVVRHIESGFSCWFLPDSDAVVTVIAVEDISRIGDDAVCIEHSGNAQMAYRIARVSGATIEQVFEDAKTNARGFLTGEITETEGVDSFTESPVPPKVALDIPRLETVQLGEADGGPAMVRTSVARRPGDWFITQQYFEYLPQSAEPAQLADLALQGSVIAESVFATRLGEMITPRTDTAPGQP